MKNWQEMLVKALEGGRLVVWLVVAAIALLAAYITMTQGW